MQRWTLVAGLAAFTALGPGTATGQSDQGVTVRAYRFYRAESRQTLVTAFVEVPYAILEAPASDSAGADLKYGVVVSILDANGVRLNEASWPGRARADLRAPGAVALEMLDFTLAPGKFRIEVAVTDSVSGRKFSSARDIEAWSEPPTASDLMLSPSMRLVTGSDTLPQAGEKRWGNTLVTPATRLRLTPVRAKAFYLLEAYAAGADSGTMQVQVTDTAGHALVTTRPTPVRVAPGGSVLKGQLDLTGLPSGLYTLAVKLDLSSRTEERSDRLVMGDFQEAMEKEEQRLAVRKVSDEGYFGTMNEDQLDEAEAPLFYLATSDSLAVWKSGLSLAAKRQFLTRFWQQRDPTPGTERNEAREAFYQAIDLANEKYGEKGRAGRTGWRTDRGRIRIRNGEPNETLDRRTSLGKAPPYEVWRYTRGKERYYIFADRTGFGNYQLVATNDLRETGKPDFNQLLGADALQDISRFIAVDLFRGDRPTGVGDPAAPSP
jgi:GWxTD domain-containing protein